MIVDSVLKAISDHNMIKNGDSIVVAVSGGADSVCLLHIMFQLSKKLGFSLCAAHLNHGIRGDEAERDEAFVKELCERLGIKLYCEKADIPTFAEENKMSIELAARKVRYDFLSGIGGIVATAHNADDNLETLVLNLARGTSLKGLCGIPPVRDGIIRPLIYCTRAEIEAYLEKENIFFVTDSTNLSDDYTRNKIRHKIIPVLREINPSVENAAARAAHSVKEASDYIEELSAKELRDRLNGENLSVKGIDTLNKAVAKRLLMNFCKLCGIEDISSSHLSQLYHISVSGGECTLPEKTLENASGYLRIKEKNPLKTVFNIDYSEISPEEFRKNKKINNLLLKNYLDCDKIKGKLVLRTRLVGDSVRLKNKNGTKTLKKLYTEYKIPIEQRDSLPVLSDDNGIVWVYKIGVAERCAADEKSNKILKINVTERFGDNK